MQARQTASVSLRAPFAAVRGPREPQSPQFMIREVILEVARIALAHDLAQAFDAGVSAAGQQVRADVGERLGALGAVARRLEERGLGELALEIAHHRRGPGRAGEPVLVLLEELLCVAPVALARERAEDHGI